LSTPYVRQKRSDSASSSVSTLISAPHRDMVPQWQNTPLLAD
jgi:hypothetical protein